MAKRDAFSRRLKDLIDFISRPKDQSFSLASFLQPAALPVVRPNLNDPKVWAYVSRAALTLHPPDSHLHNASLSRAFDMLKLDPADPFDWYLLAAYLAHLTFPPANRGGKPKEWDTTRYCQLLEAVDRSKAKRPGRSDREACAAIARKSEPFFEKAGAEGLRKALQRARSHETNEAVRALLDLGKPAIARIVEENGGIWNPRTEELYRKLLQRKVADWIGKRWRRGDKTA